jgi:putative ABC transport system permease protein
MGGLAAITVSGLRSRRRGGLVATFLVLVLAAVGIAAGLTVARRGATLLDDAARETDVAHLVLYGDPAAIASVAADPEVTRWSGPFATRDDVELVRAGAPVPMQLTALASPDIAVGRPLKRAGRWATAADEVVLDHSVGVDLGIDVGDDITVRVDGNETTLRVVGTAVNFTDCFYPQCDPGRAWVTPDGLARVGAPDRTVAQGWLRFEDPAEADPFVQRIAASGVEGIRGTESWLDTRGDFLAFDRIFGSFVAAFGVFVLAVAAVVIAGATAVRVVAQRRQIGLLGAIGATPRQITAGLLVESLCIGVVASATGWFLGGFLAPALQIGIGRTLGAQGPSWSFGGLLISVAAIAVLLTIATLVPAISAARRPVTDVLRDVPPERVSWLNRRTASLPRRLPLLGAREAASRPTSGGLAALALVVAVVGVLVSAGFVAGIGAIVDDPARAGDPWDVVLLPVDVPPAQVEAELRDTPGVERWFSEVGRRSTLDEGAFLSVAQGGDPAAAAYRVAEGRQPAAAGEAMAGYGFLERFGLAVGDHVDFLAGTTPIGVDIVGMYRETEDSGEILRYRLEALTAAEPGVTPDAYRIVVDDGSVPDQVGRALVERLGPSTRIELLDTGIDDLAPLLSALRLIALVLVAMALVNLLTTLLTANREAADRVGVQLALGFTTRQIVVQAAVAGVALGLVATVIGLPLGYAVFRILSDSLSRAVGVGPGWMGAPAAGTAAVVAVTALAVTAAVGALAVVRLAQRPASELLHRE